MPAPTPTARTTPTGSRLDDGYQTLITFATEPAVKLWEKTVTPPGIDGGDPIDTTTQHNEEWKTQDAPGLKMMTGSSFTAAYDPAVFDDIVALINVHTTITITFPDGSTLAFFGWLRSFEPDGMSEGEQPEATVNIEAANQDATGAEQAPVYGT